MGILTREETRALIDWLASSPLAANLEGRRSLLLTLPEALRQGIPDIAEARPHLARIIEIVDSDVWAVLPDGTPAVAVVVENARSAVQGSTLADRLNTLLLALKTRSLPGAAPPSPSPASPAQTLPAPTSLQELHRLLTEIQERLHTAIGLVGRLQSEPERSE